MAEARRPSAPLPSPRPTTHSVRSTPPRSSPTPPSNGRHCSSAPGDSPWPATDPQAAEERLRAAYRLFDEAGATHDAARVAASLGVPIWNLGRIDEAIELMENAFAVLASDEPDADVAMLTAQLGRLHYFAGNLDTARERIELALETAEELDLPGVLAGALNTKSLVLQNRPHESHALLREALAIALSHDLVFDALRAYNNLLVRVILDDRRDDVGPLTEEALLLARRRGDRFWEVRFRWGLIEDLRNAGEWDRLLAEAETLPAVELRIR